MFKKITVLFIIFTFILTAIPVSANSNVDVYQEIVDELNLEYDSNIIYNKAQSRSIQLSPDEFKKAVVEQIEFTKKTNEQVINNYEKETNQNFNEIIWQTTQPTPRYNVSFYSDNTTALQDKNTNCYAEGYINNKNGYWEFESITKANALAQEFFYAYVANEYTSRFSNLNKKATITYKGIYVLHATSTASTLYLDAEFYSN